jgi:hypothetical protein
VRGLAAYGPDRTAHDLGDFRFRQVLVVTQDQYRPLARGRRAYRLPQGEAAVDLAGAVRGDRLRRLVDHALASPARTSPTADLFVVHHAAHVPLGIAADGTPATGRLRQRGLQQVLGGVLVVGQEVRQPDQALGPADDEACEILLLLGIQRLSSVSADKMSRTTQIYGAPTKLGHNDRAVPPR